MEIVLNKLTQKEVDVAKEILPGIKEHNVICDYAKKHGKKGATLKICGGCPLRHVICPKIKVMTIDEDKKSITLIM